MNEKGKFSLSLNKKLYSKECIEKTKKEFKKQGIEINEAERYYTVTCSSKTLLLEFANRALSLMR